MTVSVVLDKTPQECPGYTVIFWCKSVHSLAHLFLSLPLCGRPSAMFPRLCQSATAYISVSRLSRSRIHTPANHRSTPSIHPIHLSVKQLCSLPLSPSSFQKSPLPQKRQDPEHSLVQTKRTWDVIQMHTCKNKQKGRDRCTPARSWGNPPSLRLILSRNLIIRPPAPIPPPPSCQSCI